MTDYIICIPSYKRADVCNNKTLKTLSENNINPKNIYVYVANKEDYNLYDEILNKTYYNKLVVGKKGLVPQRQYIMSQWPTNKQIVFFDDDIEKIDLSLSPEFKKHTLDYFIKYAFAECLKQKSYIWGVYAVFNPFFRKARKEITTDLNYIVGARIANLSISDIEKISKELNLKDNATFRIKTSKGILICHFASNRYRKDKIEMEKQINKAKFLLKESDPNPARKRTRFLKHKDNDKNNYELNTQLIHKTNLLLGIKGYYSNLENMPDIEIIKQYRNLWRVEKAFRISKSDLQIRPIFHFKEYSIHAHLLVCFMALAICKFIEIKTGRSIGSVLKILRGVTDARIFDKVGKREVVLRSEISGEVVEVLRKVGLSY